MRVVLLLTVIFLPVAAAVAGRAAAEVSVSATVIRRSHLLDGGVQPEARIERNESPDGGVYEDIVF